MQKLLIDRINILPDNLTISTENLWHIINQAASVLILDINNLTILFANPNSLKELRIIENDTSLSPSEVLGRTFKFPITYGEKFRCVLELADGSSASIEIVNSIITWNNTPAFLVILKSCIMP